MAAFAVRPAAVRSTLDCGSLLVRCSAWAKEGCRFSKPACWRQAGACPWSGSAGQDCGVRVGVARVVSCPGYSRFHTHRSPGSWAEEVVAIGGRGTAAGRP